MSTLAVETVEGADIVGWEGGGVGEVIERVDQARAEGWLGWEKRAVKGERERKRRNILIS
jgi:hypothetical protein